eukprot:763509-Hanusia_phi.AAC.1
MTGGSDHRNCAMMCTLAKRAEAMEGENGGHREKKRMRDSDRDRDRDRVNQNEERCWEEAQ